MNADELEKWRRRLYSDAPILGSRIRRRAVAALAADGSPQAVRLIAEAWVRDYEGRNDPAFQAAAAEALRSLQDQAAIDAVCSVWQRRHVIPPWENLFANSGG